MRPFEWGTNARNSSKFALPDRIRRIKGVQLAITNGLGAKAAAQGITVQQMIQNALLNKSAGTALTKFTSGKQGDTVRSVNVAIDHLAQLRDAANALQNGNVPIFNSISQAYQKATGNPIPSNAAALRGVVSDEVNKAVLGSSGAVSDRQDLKDNLNVAGSPAQIVGAINSYTGLMAGQVSGLKQQYEQATRMNDFERFLSPRTISALGVHGSPQAPVHVTSPQQAAGLPPGTHFVTPDGRQLVKH